MRLLQFNERAERCRYKLSPKGHDFVLSIMQNHNNDGIVHSKVGRFLSSGPEEVPKRAKESHQLRLKINRRQMRRSPAGLIATGDRFLNFPPPANNDCFRQIQSDTWAQIRLSPSDARISDSFSFYCNAFNMTISFKATRRDNFFQNTLRSIIVANYF